MRHARKMRAASAEKYRQTIVIFDGIFSITERRFGSNRRKDRQNGSACQSTAVINRRQINGLGKTGRRVTMDRE